MKSALLFASLGALGLMAAAGDESPPAGAKPPPDLADAKAAQKATAEAAEAAAKQAAKDAKKKVKVRVLIGSLGEDDQTYSKGQEFTTTAERAAALGDSVEAIN